MNAEMMMQALGRLNLVVLQAGTTQATVVAGLPSCCDYKEETCLNAVYPHERP